MQKSEKIEDYIFKNIRAGRWCAGDKLPSEKEMCAALNVSEVTLRVALKTLANRGIIKRRRGAGSYVSSDIAMNKIIIFAKMESFAYNTGYIYRMIATKLKDMIAQNGMISELVIADGATTEELFDNIQFERRNDLHEIVGAISLCSCSKRIYLSMKKYHIPLVNLAGYSVEGSKKDVGNFIYLDGTETLNKCVAMLRKARVSDFAFFRISRYDDSTAIPEKSVHHDILAEFGLPADDRHFVSIPREWDRHSAYQVFANWVDLPDRPKVAFFLEDNICTQALYAIWERQIKIPDDLQILTISNGQFFHSPVPLTKFEWDTSLIAELLFNSIMALRKGKELEFPVIISAEYKPGESLIFANNMAKPIAKITEKNLVRPSVLPGQYSPWKTESDYCFADGDEKFEVWSDIAGRDRYDNFRDRFSADNGVTWGNIREIFVSQNENGNIHRWCELFQNLEKNSNSIYRMYLDGIYENDINDETHGSLSFQKNRFIAVQRSFNGGKNFSEAENITAVYRKNFGIESDQLLLSCAHLCSLNNGTFIVPLCLQRKNVNMTGIMLIGKSDMQTGCCRTQWSFSKPLVLEQDYSDYHLTEGTVAVLPDGRLLAVYRAHSTQREKNKTINWVKFFAVSKDNGLTWSKACVMRYADGKPLCSPSSMARLVMHRSGRLFMLGNIYDRNYSENADANQSRNQLAMLEIDTDTLLPLEETLVIIARRTSNMSQNTAISNFSVSVDRKRGDILVSVPVVYANRIELSDCCLMNYRIQIEI